MDGSGLLCLLCAAICMLWRAYSILAFGRTKNRQFSQKDLPLSLAVFLGSGGHTSEVIALISTLDFKKYKPRKYLVSAGDSMSREKAHALENKTALENRDILTVPRAREVHQSLLTTPLSFLRSFLVSLFHVSSIGEKFADVLILNGPGTSLSLCLAIYVRKFLGMPTPFIIYVESFARVTSLSLSGKLALPLADRFINQWESYPEEECSKNWLV